MNLDSLFNAGAITVWNVLLALAILITAFILAHFAKKGVNALGHRMPGLHPELLSLAARLVKYAIILFAIGVDLALLGANVQPLLGAVIIVVAVVFLALRGIASNFGAAIVIQTRQSIHVGQWIEVAGFCGAVTELNSRAVVVVTLDGRTIHLPNAMILETPMINHSEAGATRSSLEVRVESGAAPHELITAIDHAAALAPGVLTTHPPNTLLRSASPGGATFELRIWHRPMDDARATAGTVTAVHRALSEAGTTATVVAFVPSPPLTTPPTP